MFSVLIPVYNHERYLVEAVESAVESPLVKEVLIVDDGSRDGSPKLAERLAGIHQKVRLVPNHEGENRGAHARLNQLCLLASQPWLSVLNSDDRFLPGRFEEFAAAIKLQRAELHFSALEIVDSTGARIGCKRGILEPEYEIPELNLQPPFSEQDLFLALVSQNYIATTSNMVFSRALYNRIGGFRDYRYVHDWDFALRAFLVGSVNFVPRMLTAYRVHPGNTIKESALATDREVTRIFETIERDFPNLLSHPGYGEALSLNRHILRSEPVVLPTPKLAEEAFDSWMPPELSIRERALAESAIKSYGLDFVILNSQVLPEGMLESDSIEQRLVAPPDVRAAFLRNSEVGRRLVGRVIACPKLSHAIPVPVREKIPTAVTRGRWIVVGGGLTDVIPRRREIWLSPLLIPESSGKKRMLVLPIYMAVGGVERNTIETMKDLLDDYDFVVATFEEHHPLKATLHHQVEALGIPLIDLIEVYEREDFLRALEQLEAAWYPEVLWICNGCQWLVQNAWALRGVFKYSAIVDQEVYDDKVGWVNSIPTDGIQSFDRFIAINSRIQRKFIEDYQMSSDKIDLIYHAIDSERFSPGKVVDRSELRKAFGLKKDTGLTFAFVGRLTEQKQPLRFLELVKKAKDLEIHFIMIGDGELRDSVRQFVEHNSLKNVTPISFCEDPSKLWQIADALIMTSIFEGLPIVSLEAMAMGRPVFSTDVGDLKLVVERGRAGRIVEVDASDEIIWSEFQKFLVEFKQLSENARSYSETIRTEFGVKEIAAKYRECFDKATRSKDRLPSPVKEPLRSANCYR